MLMKTKKNYFRRKNSINNSKQKKKVRRKSRIKKIKKSRKINTVLQSGGASEDDKIGKIVTITNHPKYNNLKAKIIQSKFDDSKKSYMVQLINTNYNQIFDELPFLTEDQFKIDQDFLSTQSRPSSETNKKYVLWVVNCDSCKVSTIPYCSSNGIYNTYHYYNTLNKTYDELKKYLNVEKLTLSFYSSILLRAQETAKIITKGIKDSLPDMYDNIDPGVITIMNYCQEIQRFKTNFSKVLEHVNFLNKLIPDTLEIDPTNIMGIQENIPSNLDTPPTVVPKPDENNVPDMESRNTQEINNMTPQTNENGNESPQNMTESSEFNNESPDPVEVNTSSHTMINTDNMIEPDLEKQGELLPPERPSSVLEGGFLNFLKGLFSNSNNDNSPQEETQQPVTNLPNPQISQPTTSETKVSFKAKKNDYQNWKEKVLPYLSDNSLNIVISHGYYIKRHVLNNVSNTRADNLDGFLLEYTFTNNNLVQIHVLGKKLTQRTEITEVPTKIEIIPTTGSHLNETKDLWNNTITLGSNLEGKEKYSRCFLK